MSDAMNDAMKKLCAAAREGCAIGPADDAFALTEEIIDFVMPRDKALDFYVAYAALAQAVGRLARDYPQMFSTPKQALILILVQTLESVQPMMNIMQALRA